MSELYPLKFEPLLIEKVWGGNRLVTGYNKKGNPSIKYGESWELSAVSDNLSVVSNGFLAGNNIEELNEVYMGDLTGDAVFDKFGNEFPLLIKFIDAREDLSIQVHPDNAVARERHKAYGKTEMWYILESEENSKIYTGFRNNISKEVYLDALGAGELDRLMNIENPSAGDAFFTPAGRVHSIGAGILLVEIQQTSDITYRIYDWNRMGYDGQPRELHNDLAIDVIDFNASVNNKISKEAVLNRTENLVSCEFFTTNLIDFNKPVVKDYNLFDSFIIYICTNGEFMIRYDGKSEPVIRGETVLLPAMIKDVLLEPLMESTVLEVFITTKLY